MTQIIKDIPAVIYEAVAVVREDKFLVKEITFLNNWVEKLTGWKAEEFLSDPELWFNSIHPEDRHQVLGDCKQLAQGHDFVSRTYRFRHKNGNYIYILDTLSVVECLSDTEIRVVGVWEDVSSQREYYEVFRAVENAPAVGIVIYQETVVYVNKFAVETFGYTKEELLQKPVHELVHRDIREFVRETAERRIKGEQFDRVYAELPAVRKDGVVRILNTFTRTVYWKCRPAGFVVFIDITKQKKYERMFRMLKDINQLIISAYDERELLSSICSLLVEKAGFRMVWVGVPDEDGKRIRPLKVCGYDKGYVESLDISVDDNSLSGPTVLAFKEGRIVINPDTRTNPDVESWRDEMLKRDYLSSCSIPLKLREEVIAVLNIYSTVPNMFGQEELELLGEIQKDLSFALERIEKEKFIKLVNTAIEQGYEWVLITDEEGKILYVNRVVEELSGYSQEELIGLTPRVFKSGYHTGEFYRKLWRTIKAGKSFKAVFVNRKKDGTLFYLDQTITPVSIGSDTVRFVGFGKDVTSEKYLEEELARLKYIDPLTDLLNREGFITAVNLSLEREADREHVLFLIDILDFSGINEVYGSRMGDEILKQFARVLKHSLFRRDIVARLGGDEFAVLAKGVSERNVSTITAKLFSLFSEPLNVEGKSIKLSINVGGAFFPKDGKTAHDLLEKASASLSFAKKEGQNTYKFFDEEINREVEGYFRVKAELEKAIKEDRFLFYFQPIYRAIDMKVVGCETLLRLRGKRGKIQTPGEFIYVLEKSGLIRDVEDRMIEKLRDFILKHKSEFMVTFNVSPKSFKDERFINKVKDIAQDVGDRMVLEITERLFVENPDYAISFLNDVRSWGVKVAVDDFGTGYSSLAYLERLPVDILKIDMEFVHRMTKSDKSLSIVETVVELARRLGMETIAEGVENADQLRLLKLIGCTYVQGYYLGKPMSEKHIERLLV